MMIASGAGIPIEMINFNALLKVDEKLDQPSRTASVALLNHKHIDKKQVCLNNKLKT